MLPRQTYSDDRFTPYAAAIGRATLAWNALHEALGLVLWAMTGEDDGVVALAIWNSLKSDRTKRDILIAASAAIYESKKWDFDNDDSAQIDISRLTKENLDILFLCDSCTQIEEDRNNAVHSPLLYNYADQRVDPFSHQGNTRAQKLIGYDLLSSFDLLRERAILLRDFALSVEKSMRDERLPWPNRPELPGLKPTKRSRDRQC
ncbi:hypothetical protein [Ancylobacter novellus]|uniref:hypothetical protein n=1 Tax=Ancylobacter novellus TaxID=921 RepID=UPI001184E9A8|nr:hypothetical protein [Ancylobacter novellus]